MVMKPKKKKGTQKGKLNITLREETKQRLAALASLPQVFNEKRPNDHKMGYSQRARVLQEIPRKT